MDDEQVKSFQDVVEPVMEWLNNNNKDCNPHHSIVITANTAELKSGELFHRNDNYLKD